MDKALEAEYWREMLRSKASCWLLRELLKQSLAIGPAPPTDYMRGQHDLVYTAVTRRIISLLGREEFVSLIEPEDMK